MNDRTQVLVLDSAPPFASVQQAVSRLISHGSPQHQLSSSSGHSILLQQSECYRSGSKTHQCCLLQRRCTSIKDKYGLYAVEEQLAYPAKESQNMRIGQCSTVFVAHGGLELIDPDTGVDSHSFALHSLQPAIHHQGLYLERTKRKLASLDGLQVSRDSIMT